MAGRARIRHLVLVRHGRSNELECMGADERTRYTLRLDLRHMTGNALAAGTAIFVVRVLFQARRVRPVGRVWTVAVET